MNQGIQPRPYLDRAEGDSLDPMEEEAPEQATASLDDNVELQKQVLDKIRTHTHKGKSEDMAGTQQARDQRLYFRGIQNFEWVAAKQDVEFTSPDDDEPYSRVFNVIQGYGKSYAATLLGASPKARAEADDPFDPASIRAAAKAKTFERVYRKFNDIGALILTFAFRTFTDGRVISETVIENGVPMTKLHGVLESRVSFAAKELKEIVLLQLEDEYPLAQLKRKYPNARKKLNSGNGDSYARNARLAVKRQAGSDTSIDVQSGEDASGLGTETRSIMRPDFYEEFTETVRVQLDEMFPEGFCIEHSGDVYLASYPYVMDDHIDVIHAMPGDGMSRPSIGASSMDLQDSVNTSMNLTEEIFDHGIPTTYYGKETNIDGLNKQRERPGQARVMEKPTGEPARDQFFETQTTNPSAQLMEYQELLRGPLMQTATAQQPALSGGEMEDQKTAHGYAQAKTMALGMMAIVWKPLTSWNARELTRAVKLFSSQQNEITTTLDPAIRGGRSKAVRMTPGEVQGTSFTNASDENFPESYTERGNKLMTILQTAGPMAMPLLEEPDNLYLLKQIWGLDDLVVPGEDIRNNVLEDIAQMEYEHPVPDPSQMPEQPMPGIGMPTTQPIAFISSVALDSDYLDPDDLQHGYKTTKRWINSAEGREARAANPDWYKNVSLYGLQYKKLMAPPPPPPTNPMSISANWKDLPPDAQIAALATDQIQANPATIGANKQVPAGTQGAMNA